MNYVGSLIGVTLMWIVGCLPVVTIGASTIAMYYAVVKVIRRNHGYLTKEFFSAYKKNLKNGIIMTLIFLVMAVVLYMDRMIVDSIPTSTASVFSLGYTFIILIAVGVAIYIFPVISRFDMGKFACFKLALIMVFRHLPYTIVFFAILVAAIFLVGFIPIPFIFIVPGAACFLKSLLMEKLLKKYMAKPQTEEEEQKWYYQ